MDSFMMDGFAAFQSPVRRSECRTDEPRCRGSSVRPSWTQARCHSVGCVTDRGAAGETRERDQARSNHVPTSMALRSGPPVRRMKLAGQPSTLTRLAMPHREPVVSPEPSTRHTSSVTSSPGPTLPTGLNGSQMVSEA